MKIKYLFILLSILITSNIYAGGGWTNEKGTAYIKVSGWWVESKNFFSGNGSESRSNVSSGLFNINIYAEYGITDKLTAIGYIPFFSRAYQNREVDQNGNINETLPGGDLNSFGDSEIGLKYNLYKNDRFSIATSLTLGLPFGNDGSDQELLLTTGDGEFNQIVRVDIGASLFQNDLLSIYGNAYFGYNNRTKGFSDELRGGAEIGAGILDKKLWLISKLDIIESTKNGDTISNNDTRANIFANNAEVINLTFETSYYITEKIGISASIANPLSGVSGFDAPAYSGGIFFDLK